jgi:hypothetical protein
VSAPERAMPPLQADERATLEGWLDFYRATLVGKCDGLTDEQLRTAAVPPSPLTLLGLVQHAAGVERNWFRRVLLSDDVPPIYGPATEPTDQDGGFDLADDASLAAARATWDDEVAHSRTATAARGLDETSPFMGGRSRSAGSTAT